jgi:tetratricopeptide (TPR) repeat protein
MATESQFSRLDALVIDDMSTQQTTLRGQLGMLGIGKIDAASSADDAIRLIKTKNYGLILCDYNLNSKTDGQQLFEYLREHQMLRADCLFFMITAESTYNSVAAASEHMPDAYLLKPVTAGDIEDRLRSQLEKRQALLAINKLLSKNDLAGAMASCDALLAKRDRWIMQALQLKGQIALDLGLADEARRVYQNALGLRANLLWAQIGMARAQQSAGKHDEARQLAQNIIDSPDGGKNLAAFDIVAQSLEALGDSAAAMDALQQATQVVPSARRLRLLAESAYRNGDLEQAKASLSKAIKASQGSITAQAQDLLALAQTQIDLGEAKQALETLADSKYRTQQKSETDMVTLALRAQAHTQLGETAKALEEASQAMVIVASSRRKADFATVAVARAALMTNQIDEGMELLRQAVNADHENPRIQQLACKALIDTGHAEHIEHVVLAVTQGFKARLLESKRLLRSGNLAEALQVIEAELHDFPENTAVLLECAQMNCMALRMNKRIDNAQVKQVRDYLARLEKLLPGNDRVAQMRRYLRETLETLTALHGASTSAAAAISSTEQR